MYLCCHGHICLFLSVVLHVLVCHGHVCLFLSVVLHAIVLSWSYLFISECGVASTCLVMVMFVYF